MFPAEFEPILLTAANHLKYWMKNLPSIYFICTLLKLQTLEVLNERFAGLRYTLINIFLFVQGLHRYNYLMLSFCCQFCDKRVQIRINWIQIAETRCEKDIRVEAESRIFCLERRSTFLATLVLPCEGTLHWVSECGWVSFKEKTQTYIKLCVHWS